MILNPPKTKKEHDYIFLELARSLCPVCLKLIDAKLVIKDNKVFMRKRCQEHGFFEALIFSDAQMYMKAMRFNKPGTIPLHFETNVKEGCPRDCGLCPEHEQHSCLGILEITQSCNLECPTCFSNSSPLLKGYLSLDQIKFMLDKFIQQEGKPEIIQLSGGEPTIHPEIIEIIKETKKRNIEGVMINTNGLRLAHDKKFQEDLANLENKPGIYLQFDGFKESTYEKLRKRKGFLEEKMQAIEAARNIGIKVVLAVTVQRGVNEDELGDIVKFAKNTPPICGINFQPTTYTQRYPDFNPMERITNADVIHAISSQSGLLRPDDFVPVPCCYPNCQYVTYVYNDNANDVWIPFSRIINVEESLDYIKNQSVASINRMTRESLEGLWSAAAIPGSQKVGQKLNLACCGIDLDINLPEIEEKTMMISVLSFLDIWTFDLKRVMKCCIAEINPDGRIIPFCAYNVLYRNGGDKSAINHLPGGIC